MLRFGNISEFDAGKCYARVKFLDDDIVSAPRQILVRGALGNKDFFPFDINEQVACLMDENSEQGVILGATYNDKTPPDGDVSKDKFKVLFPDGSFTQYDRDSHEYTISIQGNVKVLATGNVDIEAETATVAANTVEVDASQVTVDADQVDVTAVQVSVDADVTQIISPVVNIEGEVAVNGNLTVTGTVTASTAISTPSLSGPGVTMSGGNIAADGEISATEVKAGTIPLATHKHSGVTTGGGTSGTPTP